MGFNKSSNELNKITILLGWGIIFSYLLPAINIGSFGLKLDTIFVFLSFPILFSYSDVLSKNKIVRKFIIVSIIIFFLYALSGTLGASYVSNSIIIHFPTEFLQIFTRISVFILFLIIGYKRLINYNTFINIVSTVFLLSLLWGVAQSINISIVKDISLRYYALSDNQEAGFTSLNFRGFGTAGNILTWGGLSSFMFYFFYFLSINKKIKIAGCVLALYNLSTSASRGAILSLVISFVIIQIIDAILIKKKFTSLLKNIIVMSVLVIGSLFIFIELFPERFELLEMRFSGISSAIGETGRQIQLQKYIDYVSLDFLVLILGIGKPVADNIGMLETEPLFLLFTFGIICALLHYRFILIIFGEIAKYRVLYPRIFLFIVAASISYVLFSFGYFFFREIYSGLPFWWLSGFLIGAISKFPNDLNTTKNVK